MKNIHRSDYFKFNWILRDQIAVGPAPRRNRHLEILKSQGIISLLALCSEDEAVYPSETPLNFNIRRNVLPDHRSGRLPTLDEVQLALSTLEELSFLGPVFVHCVAAMERSPLICMAWLVEKLNLSPQEALDYLMEVNPGTNPLPGQISLLNTLARTN